MKKPFTISIGIHAAILFAALVVLPTPKPFVVTPVQTVQVDISQISDKSQQAATAKDALATPAKPAPKPTKLVKDVPPAPKVADEVKTAAHEPIKKEPTPPEPNPDPTPPEPKILPPDPADLTKLLKTVEPPKTEEPKPVADDALKKILEEQQAAEDQKKAEEKKKADDLKKKAELKKKADEKKKRAEQLAQAEADLLNKIKGESTAPAKPNADAGSPKLAATDKQGKDAAATATIIDALRSQLNICFSPPVASRELKIVVPVHFALNQDGTVSGQPQSQSGGGDPLQDGVGRAGVAAIMECQPFKLPPENYDLWKDNVFNFDSSNASGT